MKRIEIYQRTTAVVIAVSFIAWFAAGCSCAKKVEPLQRENQMLSQRVAELEEQLKQKESTVYTAPTPINQTQIAQPSQVQDTAVAAPIQTIPSQAGQAVYIVAKGDTLWSIARKKLGSGTRYKEILALNPSISQDKPLIVGTKLTIPAR